MSILKKSKDFIIRLALDKFKEKRQSNIQYNELDVISIPKNKNSDAGFEIFSKRSGDSFRLRIYITFSNDASLLNDFILKDSEINPLTSTKSYVYVCNGFLERKYIWNEEIKLTVFEPDDDSVYSIVTEDGEIFVTENGDSFLLEAA